jgi:hypothetical protein
MQEAADEARAARGGGYASARPSRTLKYSGDWVNGPFEAVAKSATAFLIQ